MLLHAVTPVNEIDLQSALAKLVEAEILYQRGLGEQARYFFKHALIQDMAYQSLLKSTRQQLHQQIAHALEEQFPDTKEGQPELLAHHYTEAGLIEQAISYWQQAGQRAVQRSANVEAVAHFTRGLEALKTLPDTQERAQQELPLQIGLGRALLSTKGGAAFEVGATFARARVLCQQVPETPQLFPVLWGLRAFYSMRGEPQTAREVGEQFLRLAQSSGDPAFLIEAHYTIGAALITLGEFALAREHDEQGIVLYDPQQHRSHALLYAQDPGVGCLAHRSIALWYLGYPDQALRDIHSALTLAHERAHPYSLALALYFAAWCHQLRREGQSAQASAEAELALSSEHGFAQWLALGTILRGSALGEQGQEGEGITQMRQGLAAWRTIGAEGLRPTYLALLAEAYGKTGQVEEGLTALAEALAAVEKTGERECEAELYRLKGELTLQGANQKNSRRVGNAHQSVSNAEAVPVGRAHPTEESEAEACFQKAIAIAQRQQAKSLELRAVMSLARLRQHQAQAHATRTTQHEARAKLDEAHQVLSEIYHWFIEGFDTKDLQEAKALLDALT